MIGTISRIEQQTSHKNLVENILALAATTDSHSYLIDTIWRCSIKSLIDSQICRIEDFISYNEQYCFHWHKRILSIAPQIFYIRLRPKERQENSKTRIFICSNYSLSNFGLVHRSVILSTEKRFLMNEKRNRLKKAQCNQHVPICIKNGVKHS